jgi:hypothetical protein
MFSADIGRESSSGRMAGGGWVGIRKCPEGREEPLRRLLLDNQQGFFFAKVKLTFDFTPESKHIWIFWPWRRSPSSTHIPLILEASMLPVRNLE